MINLYRLLDWLKTAAGMHVRFGVMANHGTTERSGFVTERHAKHWAWRQGLANFEIYHYDARHKAVPAVSHFRSVRPVQS